MVFDPFTVWGESNTKLTIIHILSRYNSLPAKKIFNKLKKEFGVSITYQATHKALKKLFDGKVLNMVDNEYQINPEWVQNMKVFAGELEKSPDTISEIFKSLDSGKTVNFTARTEAEMGYFMLDLMGHFVASGGHGPLTLNLFFVWTIFPLKDEQFKALQQVIKNNSVYVISREGMLWDKAMKKHWEDVGAKVAIGKKDCVSNCDVLIFGDYIINIYWEPEHLKMVLDDNAKMKSESDFNYNEVYEIITKPTKIDFVIVKNKEVAENIRKRSLKCFEDE
ncbi:hypothetical protein ACFL6I_17100 [candidate division KSB1 bacterium]